MIKARAGEKNRQPSKFESEKAKKSKFEEIHKTYLFFSVNRCIIYAQLNKRELVYRLRGRCDLRPRT